MATHDSGHASQKEGLRKGTIGVLGIVFFVVAAAAPLAGMTGAAPVAIVLGSGSGTPGAYLLVGLVLLLFSVGYAAMTHRVTNAGAFFAYVGRGLGTNMGVGSAFVSMVAYLAVQWCIYGFFGAVMAGQMSAKFGIDVPWYGWALIALVIATVLSVLRVDVGAKVLGVLMLAEMAALIVTAVAVLIDGGPEGWNLGASFSPSSIFAGGLLGTAGIAFAFAFASFIGFEATAIYGEETKDPKRAVPRATYLAVGVISSVFVLVTFAMVTAMGASEAVNKTVEWSSVDGVPLADPANVLITVASTFVAPWLGTLMGWLILTSLFAAVVAFQNSASRYLFAMSRGGVLPPAISKVNSRGAPQNAAIITSVLAVIVILYFQVNALDPILNLFYWMSATAVIAIVLVEILVSIAVIAFFAKNKLDENVFVRLIAPVLAAIGLAFGQYLLMSRFSLLAGTVAPDIDPTVTPWAQNLTGTVLLSIPFAALLIGYLIGLARKEKDEAIKDLVS
jgi:amino acid transporter